MRLYIPFPTPTTLLRLLPLFLPILLISLPPYHQFPLPLILIFFLPIIYLHSPYLHLRLHPFFWRDLSADTQTSILKQSSTGAPQKPQIPVILPWEVTTFLLLPHVIFQSYFPQKSKYHPWEILIGLLTLTLIAPMTKIASWCIPSLFHPTDVAKLDSIMDRIAGSVDDGGGVPGGIRNKIRIKPMQLSKEQEVVQRLTRQWIKEEVDLAKMIIWGITHFLIWLPLLVFVRLKFFHNFITTDTSGSIDEHITQKGHDDHLSVYFRDLQNKRQQLAFDVEPSTFLTVVKSVFFPSNRFIPNSIINSHPIDFPSENHFHTSGYQILPLYTTFLPLWLKHVFLLLLTQNFIWSLCNFLRSFFAYQLAPQKKRRMFRYMLDEEEMQEQEALEKWGEWIKKNGWAGWRRANATEAASNRRRKSSGVGGRREPTNRGGANRGRASRGGGGGRDSRAGGSRGRSIPSALIPPPPPPPLVNPNATASRSGLPGGRFVID